MGRFLIIDTSRCIKKHDKEILMNMITIHPHLRGFTLTTEETLEVFKSCYDVGYETGASTYNDDYHGSPIEFDEFKKSL